MYLKPDITLIYTSRIWNISAIGDKMLLLELRDEDTLSAYYDLYDVTAKKYLWQDLELNDSWKTGLSYLSEDLIIFHQFKQGTVPEIAKIIACKTLTGEELWIANDVQPLEFGVNCIKVLKDDQVNYISKADGSFIEDCNFEAEATEFDGQPKMPLSYSEGSANFTSVKIFVEQNLHEQPVGKAEYLEHNKNIFIAYHVSRGEMFGLKLVALTDKGNIWFSHEVEVSDKILSDIFFIWSGYLFFVTGQHTINAIYLKEK